jgi:elongation factor Ts
MMDCKRALDETGGDFDRAVALLRERGQAAAAKKAGRTAEEGLVASYIHPGGRVGTLIEVNCETDFVAKTDAFAELAHNLAMQVAAQAPRWVRRDDVPAAVVAEEQSRLRREAELEGKPAAVVEKIVDGRLARFYREHCLLEQPYVKDPDQNAADMVLEPLARLGELISGRRVLRFERGEGLD